MVSVTLTSPIKNLEAFLSHCTRRRYPAKSTLICAGDISNMLYYIMKGSVTVSIEDETGHEIIVAYLNNGDFVGELGLFDEKQPRTAWVKTKTECEVAEISYPEFHRVSQQDPTMLFTISTQLANRLKNTTQKVGNLAFMDVTGRIARTLLDLCKQPDAMTHPDGMQIKITRQDIGRLVGCSREMAGRVLKNLEEQGLISVKGKTMVVFGTR